MLAHIPLSLSLTFFWGVLNAVSRPHGSCFILSCEIIENVLMLLVFDPLQCVSQPLL